MRVELRTESADVGGSVLRCCGSDPAQSRHCRVFSLSCPYQGGVLSERNGVLGSKGRVTEQELENAV